MDKNVDIENEDELWLSEYNASLNWDESLFDDLPAIIGHEYARLRYLFDRHKVYASIIEIKDVYDSGTSMVAYGGDRKIVRRELNVSVLYLISKLAKEAKRYYKDNIAKFDFFKYEWKDERTPNSVLWFDE